MPASEDSGRKAAPRSTAELQGMALLNRSPAALAFRGPASLPLPDVREAPSLDGLEVAMPAPAGVSAEALIERFDALCRAVAPRRERESGEAVALGDDVLLDVIGSVDGRLIPFSARVDWWTQATPDPLLPGFFESLSGALVGEGLAVEVVLPDDYAVESLRGRRARFGVEVKAAREVTPLDEESEALFTALGRGATMDEVMEQLARELADEDAERRVQDFRQRVLEEVARRTQVDVPDSLVDESLRARWSENEYPLLVRLGIPPEQLPEAFEGWQKDAATRAEATFRLRLALGLRAITERDGVRPQREDAEALFDGLVDSAGLRREELGRLLQSDKALGQKFDELALHVAAVGHVLSKAIATPEPVASASE
ncbi:peptidylprolyl isomerase [Pyxidicoccus sp. 3LFB2]